MADVKAVKDVAPYFCAYRVGLVYASVCAEGSVEDIADRLNREHPTGISSRWALSSDPTFTGGEPNPCQCPDRPEAKHYLFSC